MRTVGECYLLALLTMVAGVFIFAGYVLLNP